MLAAASVDQWSGAAEADGPAIVLLTDADHPVWTAEALRLGIRAALPRNASAEAIIAAVEAAGSDMALVDPLDLEALLGAQESVSPVAAQAVGPRGLADPSRDRGTAPDGGRRREQGDRVAAGDFRAHGQVPCGVDSRKAQRVEPHGSGDSWARQGLILM